VLEHRLGDIREDGELGRERRAALREPAVERHLTLELAEHAALMLGLELWHLLRRHDIRMLAIVAQHHAERIEQLDELGRARDEIRGAGAARQIAIGLLDIARRDQHERQPAQRRILAHLHRQPEAVELRHHHVRDDHVRRGPADRRERRLAIGHGLDLETEARQPELRELALHRIVVGDHDAPAAAEALARGRRGRRKVCLDQRHEPRRRDRLGDDVVEAHARHAGLLELGDEAREREDRYVHRARDRAQLSHEHEAIGIRQHQVLQHHARPIGLHECARALSVRGLDDLVTVALECVAHHPPRCRVVVDHHDLVLAH